MGLFSRKNKNEIMPAPQELFEEESLIKTINPEIEETTQQEEINPELITQEEPVTQEPIIEEQERIILGANPELINKIKEKIGKVKEENTRMQENYKPMLEELRQVHARYNEMEKKFNEIKKELMNSLLDEGRTEVNKMISGTKSNMLKIENELSKLVKNQDESNFINNFQSYYQLIKLCIYMITNIQTNKEMINTLLQTIQLITSEMKRNNLWETGKDAIITSLLNLKTYWRPKDPGIEELIGNSIDALDKI